MNDVTIFTPTYNRIGQLKNLYESLEKQTSHNFVWLVIDDGSSDGTREYIQFLQSKCKKFKINYIYKENEGKHLAYNAALDVMKTKWHVVVDSDDWLYEEAIERFYYDIKKIEKKKSYVGIVYPKTMINKKTPWLPNEVERVNIPDIKLVYGLNIETCVLINNYCIGDYRFPKYGNEKFMGEESFYIQLSKEGSFLPVKDIVYGFEYHDSGWTNNLFNIWKNNPMSTLYSLDMRKNYIKLNCKGLNRWLELIKVTLNIESLELATSKNAINYLRKEKKWKTHLFTFPFVFFWSRKRFD